MLQILLREHFDLFHSGNLRSHVGFSKNTAFVDLSIHYAFNIYANILEMTGYLLRTKTGI